MGRTDTGSRLIGASPDRLYAAHLDAQAVAAWRPPQGMRAEIHRFEPRVGGGYRMAFVYEDASIAGKSGGNADVFEAHFNLGNIYHDLGRFQEAAACYRTALRLNGQYADAHFYLAITLEKTGHSAEAKPHWRAYQLLSPNGEWVELAREFSE